MGMTKIVGDILNSSWMSFLKTFEKYTLIVSHRQTVVKAGNQEMILLATFP